MAYRRIGMGAGTCQVPQAGVTQVYPACPLTAPLTAYPATAYVAPSYTPAPACSSGPPGTSDSAECIALLLQTQQNNMQLANTANYVSDEGTCNSNFAANASQRASLGLPPLPNTCGSNTFDLVPTGGYTGDASVSGAQTIVDANGNPVSITPAAISGAVPNTYLAPVPVAPNSTPTPVSGGGSGSSTP